jgi:pyrimidine-nucleoside phosphorylase
MKHLMSLPVRLIAKKRDAKRHSDSEIRELIEGFMSNDIADYQMSAWLMAARLNGLDKRETLALTNAMLHSGKVLELKTVHAPRIDKHSTGGVGDKISLCLAPLVACCGVRVPMISGRGLGHTGGTLDKLEAIAGYRTHLTARAFEAVLRRVGASIIGQTAEIAPADRRIYALRDVTGTVESIPLITASILSKKLAEGVDGLVFDVKVGAGAFMTSMADAKRLAKSLIDVCNRSGKPAVALLTDMGVPLGKMIGNALETREAIDVLRGQGPADTRELTLRLGIEMLCLGRAARSPAEARSRLEKSLLDGSAFERFVQMVRAHSGDTRCIVDPRRLPHAPHRVAVYAKTGGWVDYCDPKELALVALEMGAGRQRADQNVDPAVGIELAVQVGEYVERKQPLALLHLRTQRGAERFKSRVASAIGLSVSRPKPRKLVLGRLG